ncbi:hypothetical protein MtrunA17_Chr1g0177581 [Medicago truncatula]|uniref:Uncharacterized protein n=1 Tax=Medicago truncatula TaxID=3880 RepID=A0A396JME4_MEDTR|nr:hypothetical protein MtrunA17_Chr1g0177581 [Medicago truncatula]
MKQEKRKGLNKNLQDEIFYVSSNLNLCQVHCGEVLDLHTFKEVDAGVVTKLVD